ncbi:MAG: C40 family peptidase [bacterium]|nr:C40 family peptidase [bacterium]
MPATPGISDPAVSYRSGVTLLGPGFDRLEAMHGWFPPDEASWSPSLEWPATPDSIQFSTEARFHHLRQIVDALGRTPIIEPKGPVPLSAAERFVEKAMLFKGQWYRYGGGHGPTMSRPGPVDCSGLVQQAARMMGRNLDGTADMQQRRGKAVSMRELRPGDLVFVGRPATHVGIYIGQGKVLHAPRTGERVSIAPVRWFDNARRVF